ncbi:ATP-binding protein [Streptomyces sp. SID14478]|uniref:ATP-binding protein n=1 Tax=Streptomyces sp. SID14478 TaxID=2706073 RepID=UPI0013DC6B9C|nr:ATP-binding protein [Streptomyces sp. SID14478]NEB74656.1 ATP-binding protein [Streptomyces sp. SID14478]
MTDAAPWTGGLFLGDDVLAYSACCLLVDGPLCKETAWDFVTSTLSSWHLPELIPRVRTAVDELVGNALVHGKQQLCQQPFPHAGMVNVLRDGPDVACAVFDPGTATPRRHHGTAGLGIVETVSDAWGWTEPGPHGKAVWSYFSSSGSPVLNGLIVERLSTLVEVFTGSDDLRMITAGP